MPSFAHIKMQIYRDLCDVYPPATITLPPTTYDASSDNRKATTPATSSGRPILRNGERGQVSINDSIN